MEVVEDRHQGGAGRHHRSKPFGELADHPTQPRPGYGGCEIDLGSGSNCGWSTGRSVIYSTESNSRPACRLEPGYRAGGGPPYRWSSQAIILHSRVSASCAMDCNTFHRRWSPGVAT